MLPALFLMMCLFDAALISNFDSFRRVCPSPSVNAWKINVGGSCYLITPAHVAIFVKEGKWANPSPQYDICWAKFDDDQPDALDLEHSVICDPTKVRVIFRQYYDMDAVLTLHGSEMGLTEAVIYRSPKFVVTAGDSNVPESEYCSLSESVDVGFRCMSGAIALDENDKCVGMFVKRGNLVPLKQARTAPTESVAVVVSADIARESAIIARESAIIVRESAIIARESAIIARESAIIARESAIIARESAIIARESTIIARESAIIARESAIIARESTIIARESAIIARESAIIARESAIIATLPLSPSSWLEQLIFPSISANMTRMDAKMDANKAAMDAQFRHLNDVVLKREDLSELGAVFDTRRGVFLPPANIQSTDNAESISVSAIIGSNAVVHN